MKLRKSLTLFAVIIALVCFTKVSAGGVEGHLHLLPVGGIYVGDNGDPWLDESYLITDKEFELKIRNNDTNDGDIHHLYLIIAVNMNPYDNDISVSIDSVAPDVCMCSVDSWNLVDEKGEPIVCGYTYPPHGVYIKDNDVYYLIREIEIRDKPEYGGNGNGILEYNEVTIVNISISSSNPYAKVHFDSVGCDEDCMAKEFVPPSHDATYYNPPKIPEFTTLAIPAILIIVFLLIMRNLS